VGADNPNEKNGERQVLTESDNTSVDQGSRERSVVVCDLTTQMHYGYTHQAGSRGTGNLKKMTRRRKEAYITRCRLDRGTRKSHLDDAAQLAAGFERENT